MKLMCIKYVTKNHFIGIKATLFFFDLFMVLDTLFFLGCRSVNGTCHTRKYAHLS